MYEFSRCIKGVFKNLGELIEKDEIEKTVSNLNQLVLEHQKLGIIAQGISRSEISSDGKRCLFSVIWSDYSKYGHVMYPDELSYTVRIVDSNETSEKVRGVLF